MLKKTENRRRLMKLMFSAVILQLLYISLCLEANVCASADGSFPPLAKVPEMLICAAASATAALGGGFFLEFARELCER